MLNVFIAQDFFLNQKGSDHRGQENSGRHHHAVGGSSAGALGSDLGVGSAAVGVGLGGGNRGSGGAGGTGNRARLGIGGGSGVRSSAASWGDGDTSREGTVHALQGQGQRSVRTRAREIILVTVNALDSVGRMIDIAVGLDLATAHAINTNLGFDNVDKVSKASARGTDGSPDVVLLRKQRMRDVRMGGRRILRLPAFGFFKTLPVHQCRRGSTGIEQGRFVPKGWIVEKKTSK